MEENYTPEQVQQHITNCFHSWDICEELSVKESLDEKEQGNFDRNKEHINIMLDKDWFVEGCTSDQKNNLEKYKN
tara:strand:+ start:580 stop:804 length:225 start_codon:yes stop_codon:yes gene_type:complete